MSIAAEIKKIIDPEGLMTPEDYKKAYKKYWNKLNREKAQQIHPDLKQPVEKNSPEPQPVKKVKATGLSQPEVTTAVSSNTSKTFDTVDDTLPPRTQPIKQTSHSKTTSNQTKSHYTSSHFPGEKREYKRGQYKRAEYDLLGTVHQRIYKQTKNHFPRCIDTDEGMKCVEGCAFGQYYYQLIINVENLPGIDMITLTVYPSKLQRWGNPAIWDAIVNREYSGKQLLFICHQDNKSYRLIDWKEIPKE